MPYAGAQTQMPTLIEIDVMPLSQHLLSTDGLGLKFCMGNGRLDLTNMRFAVVSWSAGNNMSAQMHRAGEN